MAVDAVWALRHVGDSDRDDLLDLCRESSIGKDSLTECFKRSLLIGRQIAPLAGDLGRRERIYRTH